MGTLLGVHPIVPWEPVWGSTPKYNDIPLKPGASISSANALTLDCQDAVAPINCFRKGVTAPATTISLVSGRGNFVTILYNCYIPVDNTGSSEKNQYPTISSILPFGTSPILKLPTFLETYLQKLGHDSMYDIIHLPWAWKSL